MLDIWMSGIARAGGVEEALQREVGVPVREQAPSLTAILFRKIAEIVGPMANAVMHTAVKPLGRETRACPSA